MPSTQKSRKRGKFVKRRSRTGTYLFLGLVLIIIVGIGWYVYASGQAANAIVYAKINTTKGLIQVELYQGKTPKTVTNFVNLANSGFYNNLVWHRIVPGFVIQTGDSYSRNGNNRSQWGQGGSSEKIPFESDGSLHNSAGYLAMARVGEDLGSGTSQFFINLADNTSNLDGKYAVFGKVISGMDVVNAIASLPLLPNTGGQPADPVPFITSITISSSP